VGRLTGERAGAPTAGAVGVVDYLSLDGEPHLVGQECVDCGAVFLDRRSGCARCTGVAFRPKRLGDQGTVRAFTVVHRAPPGVETPFVVGVVDLEGGGTVKANIVGVAPDADALEAGASVRLTTFDAGRTEDGTTVVSFAFEPL
jgi:uncharacterized OB-fold protein